MKTMFVAVIVIAAALAVTAKAQSNHCSDPGVTWSISFIYDAGPSPVPATIYSDGAGSNNPSYVNGVDGVTSVIRVCEGTNDVVMDTSGSKTRSVGWNFGQVLYTDSYTPSWSGTSFYDHSFFNIRNILYMPPGYTSADSFTFTTRMGSQLNNKGTGNRLFHLRMENPYDEAFPLAPADSTANSPYIDALVNVQHIPAVSTDSGKETWVVYPDPGSTPPQVGVLIEDQLKGSTNAGQYTMPFKFTISRM